MSKSPVRHSFYAKLQKSIPSNSEVVSVSISLFQRLCMVLAFLWNAFKTWHLDFGRCSKKKKEVMYVNCYLFAGCLCWACARARLIDVPAKSVHNLTVTLYVCALLAFCIVYGLLPIVWAHGATGNQTHFLFFHCTQPTSRSHFTKATVTSSSHYYVTAVAANCKSKWTTTKISTENLLSRTKVGFYFFLRCLILLHSVVKQKICKSRIRFVFEGKKQPATTK